jgi:RecA-family ATPase
MSAPFAVTFFRDYAATTKIEENLSLEALAERIRATTASEKDRLPWLKAARFGSLPTKNGSLRWNGNVKKLTGIVVDYDGEQMTLDEAIDCLDKSGITGLVYSSPSHMSNGHGPRWRAVCPCFAELQPDQHYRMVARLNGLFGGILAPESFTLSQAYYFGSVNGNLAHQAIVVDGLQCLDQADELDASAIGKPNGATQTTPSGNPEAPIEDIRAALAIIPNPVPSWGAAASWVEWNNFGMAVWRASGGSEEGFEEFDKWSKKSLKYDGDETLFRWRHYSDSPPSKIGFGTLVYLARQIDPNWKPPSKEKDDEPRLRVIDVITLQDKPIPERRWLVRDWIPWARVTGLYGAGGEGKTLLAQMLMTATALGQPWLGLPVRKVKTLGVFCEDDEDELHLRQADINKLYNCEFADLENMKWLARLGNDNILMTFDYAGHPTLTTFWHQLLAEARDFGAELVIFDTISDFFSGNEIDRVQVRQFGQFALGGFARAVRGPVLGLAHPSQAGIRYGTGESGSTAWDAVFRSRLYLTRPEVAEGEEPDPFERLLQRKKANWAARDDAIPLRWHEGIFKAPGAAAAIGDLLASIERRTCRRVFLDMLADSRPVSTNSHAGNYAPRVFFRRPDREGYKLADFERAMEALFASHEITEEQYRFDGHDHMRIVLNRLTGGK